MTDATERDEDCPECGDIHCQCGIDWTSEVLDKQATGRSDIEFHYVTDPSGVFMHCRCGRVHRFVEPVMTDALSVACEHDAHRDCWGEPCGCRCHEGARDD